MTDQERKELTEKYPYAAKCGEQRATIQFAKNRIEYLLKNNDIYYVSPRVKRELEEIAKGLEVA